MPAKLELRRGCEEGGAWCWIRICHKESENWQRTSELRRDYLCEGEVEQGIDGWKEGKT